MKQIQSIALLLLFILMLIVGCAQMEDFPVLKGPYLRQTPPGMTPEVFAPGIVSPDGKYLFFTSRRRGNDDIYWVDAKVINQLRSKNRYPGK